MVEEFLNFVTIQPDKSTMRLVFREIIVEFFQFSDKSTMFFKFINGIIIKRLDYQSPCYILRRNRVVSCVIINFVFTLIVIVAQQTIWKLYLILPHSSSEAWMDHREQLMVVKYLLDSGDRFQ